MTEIVLSEALDTYALTTPRSVTLCKRLLDVLVAWPESPEYMAVTACVPTFSSVVVHEACPALRATPPQPMIVLLPSLKITLPVGPLPLTVA
jgi:hypothetical protein